jgi:hypothetical protein
MADEESKSHRMILESACGGKIYPFLADQRPLFAAQIRAAYAIGPVFSTSFPPTRKTLPFLE